ncbi:MarR family winged helix-turn-helix transcriptional regulator [Croceivirga thetidis]|uniref:MarR family transcriptional regulator n=1 Tax=Croceivirga thetidis TaxID=2721623 RepID=A0ABX1GV83_9FLAO|nr:MarR family transcriptional regulator [Croceivirga thetidis]NKI32652.1 MarR family transcriptional regulator [Croceivirga thetidis]
MSRENKPYKPDEDLGFLLWHTNMLWQREQNRALDSIGLTQTQFAILAALNSLLQRSNSVTQKAIAERSNTDTMMVSKVLRTLEKKVIIERKQHNTDTRAKCVFITNKGVKIFQDAFEVATKSNATFFNKLSDENRFRKELQRIIQLDKSLIK